MGLRRYADGWDRRRVIGHSIPKIADRIVRLQSTKINYLKRGFWTGMLRNFHRGIRHKLQNTDGGKEVWGVVMIIMTGMTMTSTLRLVLSNR